MTIYEAGRRFQVCTNPSVLHSWLDFNQHMRGYIDPWGVAHFTGRRFTRRALRNMLLLVAKRDRLANPEYLNAPHLAYYHLYSDEVAAGRMALVLGTRLPARLSRLSRLKCLTAARKQGVKLSKRSAVYSWAHDGR